jgi:sigma-B regulation protein RsbU (phosphoserine phosphatase)
MPSHFFVRLRSFWRQTSRLDRAAAAVLLVYAALTGARLVWPDAPRPGFLGFLATIALVYFIARGLVLFRRHGLWSLRNRLLVAYLFIAVVPVLLLVGMAWLSAFIIYSQLGAHLLQTDLRRRVDKVASVAEAVAGSLTGVPARPVDWDPDRPESLPGSDLLIAAASRELPGLSVHVRPGSDPAAQLAPQGRFAGLTQEDEKIWIQGVVIRDTPSGRAVVTVSVPINEEFLNTLAPELGIVQLTVWRPARDGETEGLVFQSGDRRFKHIRQIVGRKRSLPPSAGWMDFEVTGTCKLEAIPIGVRGSEAVVHPVFAPFSARASQLNRQLFSSLGDLGVRPIQLLIFVGIVFLIIEYVALRAGIRLTRSITRAVNDLSSATQSVQAGDLTHTVRVQQRDQLGTLGESFNQMIASISALIEEQRQRQRLENELSIAREVQSQLFPQAIPSLPGIELAAICRAARVVSGDYYDFIPLGPNHVGIVVADISGKGISAALLMASLQAALRSQMLLSQDSWENTAEVVSRLNLHLFRNTSPDRYATLFFAVYDSAEKTLHYTNAGHLPPYYVVGDQVTKLEDGGMVVGLFDDCTFDQGMVRIQPDSILVAYSDGLIEPENVYGEQFGTKGLLDEILRRRHLPSEQVADALVQAAEDWAGTPEQADDMTVIVARMTAAPPD